MNQAPAPDLNDLRVVLTVAECASYTRAAHKLGITQPAVSRRVSALEQSLHTRLFRREGRYFVPTEAGSAFCERAGEILELVGQLPQATMQSSSRPRGSVALGLPPTTGGALVPRLVPAYRQQFPDVALRIEQGYVSDLFEMLMDKRVDVALLNGNFNQAAVDLEPLFDHQLGIVYPRAWETRSPLDGRPMPASLTLAEVAELPLVMQSTSQSMRQMLDEAFRGAGLRPNIVLEVNSFILQKSLVLPEIGCIFMSTAVIGEHERDRLGFASISDASLVYTMYLATRRTGQLTLAAKLLTKLIKQHMVPVAQQMRRPLPA